MKTISYKDRARFYDIEHSSVLDQEFLKSLVTPSVQRILEIPSGAGRNISWLSKTGRYVVAADLEPAMVNAVLMKVKELKATEKITAKQADLRNFNFNIKFDLILVPQQGFQLLLSEREAIQSLRALTHHLNSDGTIMIDLVDFNAPDDDNQVWPDYYESSAADGKLVPEWIRKVLPDGTLSRSKIQFHQKRSFTIEFRYKWFRDGFKTISRAVVKLKVYKATEFARLLRFAGLKVKDIFSDFRGTRHTSGKCRMLFLLSRE